MRSRYLFTGMILLLMSMLLLINSAVFSQTAGSDFSVTVSYSGSHPGEQTITIDFKDEWLLGPDNVYNHKLMQASFALAATGFRSREYDLSEKDHDIRNFFAQTGFMRPRTYDFNVIPSINTIASAIASKTVGDTTIIAVSVSGNNYGMEWLSNLTLDDEHRPRGFNDAADKIMHRLQNYIREYSLTGKLHLWIAGFSRAAAVANITAADAVDSGLFDAVYAYTIATPRTNTDSDAHKYGNIFNVINPFDPVPMIPFPEWGFRRYGKDLYLPSIETDSGYAEKLITAQEINRSRIIINPRNDIELHTLFDYIAFFINSATSYRETFQNGFLNILSSKDYHPLAEDILSRLKLHHDISRYQMKEFYNFLDYIVQVIYTDFIDQKFTPADSYWDPELSIQENIAYNHYDNIYRSWLFSTDDPDTLFTQDPKYTHFTITGDVDVELFDGQGNFILKVFRDGKYSIEPDDVMMADFNGETSDTTVFADRRGTQTLVVLPVDQTFMASIYSPRNQKIRFSYVLYSADRLQADVRYIYEEEYKKDDIGTGEIDPLTDGNYTNHDLEQMGLMTVQPWSETIVYSPTAVMRLENKGVPHPTVSLFLLLVIVILIIATLFLLLIFTALRWLFRIVMEKVRAAG